MSYYDMLLASKLGGGSTPTLQTKSVTITENGDSTILPDEGYDGMSKVDVSVNVSGGGEAPENDVEFIDYDGTILYSYTAEQFLALDAMPANPTHEGLTAQGWNWSLADAKEMVQKVGGVVIGQTYITDDGKTRIYITIPEGTPASSMSPMFNFYLYNLRGLTIDYGDGNSEHVSSAAETTITHTYAATGDYVVTVVPDAGNGNFWLGRNHTSTSTTYWYPVVGGANGATNRQYTSFVTKIEVGTMTQLSVGAICYCSNLKTITLPKDIVQLSTALRTSAFASSVSLKCLVIPEGITLLMGGVLNSCNGLFRISIPNTVTTIQGMGLQYVNMKKLFYPISSETISSESSANIEKIGIAHGSVGTYLTSSNYALREIVVGNGVTQIPNYFAQYCRSLKTIKLPSSITSIGTAAFNQCFSLREISIPDLVTSIGADAFGQCGALQKVILGTSLTTIQSGCFASCYALSEITLPASMTSIGSNAFSSCGLHKIVFKSSTPPAVSASNAFTGLPTDCVIYVPYSEDHSVLNAYKTATNYPNPSTYTYVEY